MGLVPQHSLAHSPNPGKDIFSIFRSGRSPAAKNEGASNAASALSYYRLAKTHAERNDAPKAHANFSLALQHAAPRQVADIAADYATFLISTGDLHKAELMVRQALTQSPNDTELVRMLAQCLVRQNKMAEGLRHFRSISTEAEARAEVAAIYREQGDIDSLVAVEQKWGGSARPEAVRPQMVISPVVSPEVSRPAPVLIAAAPKPLTAPPLPIVPRAVQRSLPPQTTVASSIEVAPKEVTVIAVATPVSSALSKSEFFDTKVPIPVPKTAPTPQVMIATSPRPMSEKPALTNPIRLTAAPSPSLSEVKSMTPPRPTIQPRRHYVVNAGGTADLATLFPEIRPAGATIPVQSTNYRR